MDLSEVQKKKSELEQRIYKEMCDFEEETGTSIYDVDIYKSQELGSISEIIAVVIEVRL